jgi:hypothetical protein
MRKHFMNFSAEISPSLSATLSRCAITKAENSFSHVSLALHPSPGAFRTGDNESEKNFATLSPSPNENKLKCFLTRDGWRRDYRNPVPECDAFWRE